MAVEIECCVTKYDPAGAGVPGYQGEVLAYCEHPAAAEAVVAALKLLWPDCQFEYGTIDPPRTLPYDWKER